MMPGNGQSLTVGICETQPLLVNGLRDILERAGEFRLLAPARDLEDAARQVSAFSPAVMILDKAFGAPAIGDLLERLQHRVATGFVIWSPSITEPEALRFLKLGARGIVRKTAEPRAMMSCLQVVAMGGTWMEDSLFQQGGRYEDGRSRSELTAREQQVLELVEQGLRNKDIARQLGIQPGTVKIHLKHIFEKTGVRGRYGLALTGLQRSATTAHEVLALS